MAGDSDTSETLSESSVWFYPCHLFGSIRVICPEVIALGPIRVVHFIRVICPANPACRAQAGGGLGGGGAGVADLLRRPGLLGPGVTAALEGVGLTDRDLQQRCALQGECVPCCCLAKGGARQSTCSRHSTWSRAHAAIEKMEHELHAECP